MILLFLENREHDQPYFKRKEFAVITYSTWELSAEVRAEKGSQAEMELAELPGRSSAMTYILGYLRPRKKEWEGWGVITQLTECLEIQQGLKMLQTIESLKLGKPGNILYEKMNLCELMGTKALDSFKNN